MFRPLALNLCRHLLKIENVYYQPVCKIATNESDQILKKHRMDDRKKMMRSLPKMEEGTKGEHSVSITSDLGDFPDIDTPYRLFNGVQFKDLPIVCIRVTKNNTKFVLTDPEGTPQIVRSNGIEGFKNCKKGTNVAAQATALTMATKIREAGVKTVRVKIGGLGPGRMSSIKGLIMGGLQIISLTDYTRVGWEPPRPRKARRV